MYKILILSHQILLYSMISHTLYGIQSSLFAMIYTIIALTNFGFEETLLPFFSTFSQSKQQFVQILIHFIGQIITTALMTSILYAILLYGYGEFLHNLRIYCNENLIFIIAAIFFVESLKKSLIAMMQLAFLHKKIAYAEITMLFTYIVTIWISYSLYGSITLHSIFLPMVITSILELSYLLSVFFNFYTTLSIVPITAKIPFKVIFKQRIYNYINQITKTIYSPNCLTLFFAYFLGFQQAATIKFFTNIITLCYTCISKSIGVTSGATFSAMNQMPLLQLQSFFKDVTQRYFQFLYVLSFVIMSIIGYAYANDIITATMAVHIIIFLTISFLEHISITYEQLLISQRAAPTLACINISCLALLIVGGYLYSVYGLYQITFLYVFIIIKILFLYTISSIANKRWGISSF